MSLEEEVVEGAAVEKLEADEVDVNGVGVLGEIEDLPDLGGVEGGFFGDGHVPGGVVEGHAHGILDPVHGLVEGEAASADGFAFGDAGDGAKGGGERGVIGRGRFGGDAELHDVEAVALEDDVLAGVGG